METMPVISIKRLVKNYGTVIGVRDISFDVSQGEIFGFLGPNGAGKTTTIRLMLDLLRPDSGSVAVFGQELSSHSMEIRRRCGYLPGNFTAYGNLTGREFINFCADLRHVPHITGTLLTERFGLPGSSMMRKIKYLSHGTKQKLGIIQAFFHKPELLILDEPTSGLDPLMQEEFYKLLDEHRGNGATVFLSSHNLSEVERICHRMAIIRNGAIEVVDSIENLRRRLKKKVRFTLSELRENISLPGAELISRQGLTWEFAITGDIRPALKILSELPLEEISLPEPGLEEIFINFYKETADA